MNGPPRIEDIELTHGLAGSEGVDPNHASRARIQLLLDQHNSLIAQTQFADAKTGGLVTLIGLLALKGPVPVDQMQSGDAVSLAAAALAAGCVLFCLLSVFPRYPGRGTRDRLHVSDRFSWPGLTTSGYGADDYARFMHTVEVSQMVHSVARSNVAVARILLRKYQMLRIAFVLGGLDFLIVFARHAGLV